MTHFRTSEHGEAYPVLPAEEAVRRLDELIRQVAEDSTRVVLTRDGKPAAVLVSLEDLVFMEKVEDEIDERLYREAKGEWEAEGRPTVPLEEVIRRYDIDLSDDNG